MQKGFWNTINRPIIGLSPMDGVTDAAMRFIAKKYGLADILYTEFVSAEGLWRIKKRGEIENKIWQDLRFDKTQGPNIVQLFGSEPESFYESAKIVCELGFDGIDINMGCPSPGLERRGGGAGLIRDKCNAVEVVEATRRGVEDFLKTQKIKTEKNQNSEDLYGLPRHEYTPRNDDIEIPVSLKTRIGSDKPDPKWWEVIAGLKMPAVAMHGRTFKQLYSGEADWEVLLQAAEVIRESGALFLGNGDIAKIFDQFGPVPFFGSAASTSQNSEGVPAPKSDSSCTDSQKFIIESKNGKVVDLSGKMDGVLVGRGAIGNPWILDRRSSIVDHSVNERLKVAVEHARKFEEVLPEQKFFVMRKHLVGYANGFPNAVELRKKLVMTNSADEVEKEIEDWLQKNES